MGVINLKPFSAFCKSEQQSEVPSTSIKVILIKTNILNKEETITALYCDEVTSKKVSLQHKKSALFMMTSAVRTSSF